jgi:hypothetical protein
MEEIGKGTKRLSFFASDGGDGSGANHRGIIRKRKWSKVVFIQLNSRHEGGWVSLPSLHNVEKPSSRHFLFKCLMTASSLSLHATKGLQP